MTSNWPAFLSTSRCSHFRTKGFTKTSDQFMYVVMIANSESGGGVRERFHSSWLSLINRWDVEGEAELTIIDLEVASSIMEGIKELSLG